jgi:hypothetical protein
LHNSCTEGNWISTDGMKQSQQLRDRRTHREKHLICERREEVTDTFCCWGERRLGKKEERGAGSSERLRTYS